MIATHEVHLLEKEMLISGNVTTLWQLSNIVSLTFKNNICL